MKEYVLKTQRGLFTIRPYMDTDLKSVLLSWKAAFKKEILPDEWMWKYHNNPAGFRTLLCLSEDGQVAVHYAGQGARTWFFDREILGFQLVDIYSHPSYRWAIGGKAGLFVKTARIFWQSFIENAPFKDMPDLSSGLSKGYFVWGLPGKRHARLGQIAVKYGRLPEAFFGVYKQAETSSKPSHFLWSVEKFIPGKDDLPNGIDGLWIRFRKKFSPFCLIKDESYVRWRYWTRPFRQDKYIFWGLSRPWSSQLRSWLVTTTDEHNNLIVLDFLADSPSNLALLLREIKNLFYKKLYVWLSSTSSWKQVFIQNGFKEMDEPLGIVPSIQGFSIGLMDKTKDFHWLMGDSDLY